MHYIQQLLENRLIITSIVAWLIAQLLKIITDTIETKKFDLNLVLASGGMPSSHTSFVTSLGFGVGFTEGFNSTAFAICAVLAMVVMYDAAGVRRAAGEQAHLLNRIVETPELSSVDVQERLVEVLGHTPLQVLVGATIGIIVGLLA